MRSSKEEKFAAKMEKFGIDLDRYSLDELRRRNAEAASEIAANLAGSKMYSTGALLAGDSGTAFLMQMNRAQVEQNFILMRQNEEIIRLLKALYSQGMNR